MRKVYFKMNDEKGYFRDEWGMQYSPLLIPDIPAYNPQEPLNGREACIKRLKEIRPEGLFEIIEVEA